MGSACRGADEADEADEEQRGSRMAGEAPGLASAGSSLENCWGWLGKPEPTRQLETETAQPWLVLQLWLANLQATATPAEGGRSRKHLSFLCLLISHHDSL